MDRRRKPKAVKARATRPPVRKAPKDAGTPVRDLEERLAASLERESATGALLQEKTRALTEALQQQAATAEILRVIRASPGDVEPVFRAIVRSATRICDATFGAVFRFDGQQITVGAHHDLTPEEIAATNAVLARSITSPTPRTPRSANSRAVWPERADIEVGWRCPSVAAEPRSVLSTSRALSPVRSRRATSRSSRPSPTRR